jgi:hypothetical protein
VLLVVAGVIVWEVLPDRSLTAPPPCNVPSSLPTRATAMAAVTGGGLRVAEQGFTQIDGDGKVVSIGILVENTSTMVAYQTPVRFRVYDANHASATPPNSSGLLSQVIPVIMPGERIGAGAWSYLQSVGVTDGVATVASVEVELGPSQWWSPQDPTAQFAGVLATHVHTKLVTDSGPTYGSVAYTVDSPYCRAVSDRGVATLFRNGAGAIIGGNLASPNVRGCAPGRAEASASLAAGIPAGIDDSRTTHYPYCDPVPQWADPAATDQPAN